MYIYPIICKRKINLQFRLSNEIKIIFQLSVRLLVVSTNLKDQTTNSCVTFKNSYNCLFRL